MENCNSYTFPQDEYALSMLTQAADAMNNSARGNPSKMQPNSPISNHQQSYSHRESVTRVQSTQIPGPDGTPIHGDYNPSVFEARSMETLAFNHPISSHGRQYGFHTNQGAGIGPRGYYGDDLGILSAESYDDGTGMLRAQLESEARMRMREQEPMMPFGITDAPRVMMDEEVLMEVLEVESGGRKKRKMKHKAPVVDADEIEEEDDDARKKARGRPRVDTKDETPAEVSSFLFLDSCGEEEPGVGKKSLVISVKIEVSGIGM